MGISRSKKYIVLVDFMGINDLVMTILINDVKMLILASTTLLVDVLAKLNNKHFMCGSFYHMRQGIDGCVEWSSNKVIDIEIGMKA
ncbi:hypothetical protein H5410_060942 [Solanum commersonii]|uniref:AIPP2-like SPOC-like domain-containing protein n=1 Tax=Solanum commersonii TaxID=4109 RepID=A0A9J5W7L3_SOLCO|nr:hypothetical protein H5410_060942 [Solanum commersonii]